MTRGIGDILALLNGDSLFGDNSEDIFGALSAPPPQSTQSQAPVMPEASEEESALFRKVLASTLKVADVTAKAKSEIAKQYESLRAKGEKRTKAFEGMRPPQASARPSEPIDDTMISLARLFGGAGTGNHFGASLLEQKDARHRQAYMDELQNYNMQVNQMNQLFQMQAQDANNAIMHLQSQLEANVGPIAAEAEADKLRMQYYSNANAQLQPLIDALRTAPNELARRQIRSEIATRASHYGVQIPDEVDGIIKYGQANAQAQAALQSVQSAVEALKVMRGDPGFQTSPESRAAEAALMGQIKRALPDSLTLSAWGMPADKFINAMLGGQNIGDQTRDAMQKGDPTTVGRIAAANNAALTNENVGLQNVGIGLDNQAKQSSLNAAIAGAEAGRGFLNSIAAGQPIDPAQASAWLASPDMATEYKTWVAQTDSNFSTSFKAVEDQIKALFGTDVQSLGALLATSGSIKSVEAYQRATEPQKRAMEAAFNNLNKTVAGQIMMNPDLKDFGYEAAFLLKSAGMTNPWGFWVDPSKEGDGKYIRASSKEGSKIPEGALPLPLYLAHQQAQGLPIPVLPESVLPRAVAKAKASNIKAPTIYVTPNGGFSMTPPDEGPVAPMPGNLPAGDTNNPKPSVIDKLPPGPIGTKVGDKVHGPQLPKIGTKVGDKVHGPQLPKIGTKVGDKVHGPQLPKPPSVSTPRPRPQAPQKGDGKSKIELFKNEVKDILAEKSNGNFRLTQGKKLSDKDIEKITREALKHFRKRETVSESQGHRIVRELIEEFFASPSKRQDILNRRLRNAFNPDMPKRLKFT